MLVKMSLRNMKKKNLNGAKLLLMSIVERMLQFTGTNVCRLSESNFEYELKLFDSMRVEK